MPQSDNRNLVAFSNVSDKDLFYIKKDSKICSASDCVLASKNGFYMSEDYVKNILKVKAQV